MECQHPNSTGNKQPVETLLDSGHESLAFDSLQVFIQRSGQTIPQERLDELLSLSTEKDLISCMGVLPQQGASVWTRVTSNHLSLLSYTAREGNINATRLLLSYNAPLDASQPESVLDDALNTPLALAIVRNYLEVAEHLLKAGADPNTEVYTYQAADDPLQYAAEYSEDREMLELLLRYGLSIDRGYRERDDYDDDDWVDHPLDSAVLNDNVAVARVLLSAGMRVCDMDGAVEGARSERMRDGVIAVI